ncbi:MAG TPA: cobalamin B12-binding domain-containing protein [Candidatus Lokiarchaeia archaeon]|nr:cobalamin B12-binding domain-containing protein [Candidatus Lokiarchaeia archaeon]
MEQERKIRVIVAKPGLDGHDRGAKVIARALRDAGMEVIYTGLHQTAAMIVESVIQEDPDVLCLSILSGAHNALFPQIMQLMKEKGIEDVLVMAGGVIPQDDAAALAELGIEGFYGPGSKLQDIIDYIRAHLKR